MLGNRCLKKCLAVLGTLFIIHYWPHCCGVRPAPIDDSKMNFSTLNTIQKHRNPKSMVKESVEELLLVFRYQRKGNTQQQQHSEIKDHHQHNVQEELLPPQHHYSQQVQKQQKSHNLSSLNNNNNLIDMKKEYPGLLQKQTSIIVIKSSTLNEVRWDNFLSKKAMHHPSQTKSLASSDSEIINLSSSAKNESKIEIAPNIKLSTSDLIRISQLSINNNNIQLLSRSDRNVHHIYNSNKNSKSDIILKRLKTNNKFKTFSLDRNERSTNLSHIMGTARKIQLYIKNRFLQLLPDGTVNGTTNDLSDYSEYLKRIFIHFVRVR